MKITHVLLASLFAAIACSCSSIDTPTGTSKGYVSARFVTTNKAPDPTMALTEEEEKAASASKIVEKAITSEFTRHGIQMGDPDAELIIAYLLLRQGTSATTMQTDHYGSGRDPEAILNEAHQKGVIDRKSPDAFETGAIVIDLLDARSSKLVSRTFAKRGLVDGVSEGARIQMINSAVAEALAPFLK